MTKLEEILANKRARDFATSLRNNPSWALFPPDFWDEMTDEQIKHALARLPDYGLARRSDMRWESRIGA